MKNEVVGGQEALAALYCRISNSIGGIMPDAKLDFSFGALSFAGEGEQDWLSKQLDKILAAAPALSKLPTPSPGDEHGSHDAAVHQGNFTEPLASHIKAKGGETNQVKRFLAAADWLRLRGAKALTTTAVTKALSDNQQKKLGNTADCLNKNVTKGFCEKSGDGFYITPLGLKELGHKT